jgi:Protein of unknown function (DUF1566)
MTRISHKTIAVVAVVATGLLLRSSGVNADAVLDCQLAKLKAAGDRAKCLTTEQGKKLKGFPFDLAGCEAQFDAAIAAAGMACRFIDNGNGTVSDLNTLLMWEKKVSGYSPTKDVRGVGTCLHCVDDRYSWVTAASEFLSKLNGRTNSNYGQTGFAGFEDWRMPNVAELTTFENCGFPSCADPIFGAPPTQAYGRYWTSSSEDAFPNHAWIIGFNFGEIGTASKDDPDTRLLVRAVRGGR